MKKYLKTTAAVWGVKGEKNRDLMLVIAVNVLTNPIVNTVCYYYDYSYEAAILSELCAFIAEYIIYRKFSSINRPLLFSLGANAASYFMGIYIVVIVSVYVYIFNINGYIN